MIRSLFTASTGMAAQQLNMDVIAHNLANANTTGFKRSRANFEDLIYQTVVSPGAKTANDGLVPAGVQIGMGVKPVSVQKLFTQGDFTETGGQLDLAVEGRGFFKVIRETEEVYTRSGSFKMDRDGYLCDAAGNRLQPETAIPREAVTVNVDASGTLSALDQTGKVLLTAELALYDFPNPAGLISAGRNLFIPTEASGEAVAGRPGTEGFGSVLQGFVENANINVVEEMVAMIVGQRAYEANSKVVKTADEMLHLANAMKA